MDALKKIPPQAFRGQHNEPAHLLHTAQEVAALPGARRVLMGLVASSSTIPIARSDSLHWNECQLYPKYS